MEDEARQMAARGGADIGPRIDVAQLRQQMEASRASLMQQRAALESSDLPPHGAESPAVLSLCPDGCWLAIGASRGLRVYEWAAVRDASNYLPDPSARFDTISGSWGGESNYVYAVAWQPDGQGVFFGGLDGRIGYLDLATRTHRILCDLPGRVDVADALRRISSAPSCEEGGGAAVLSLALSTDGSSLACCVQPECLSRASVRKAPQLMIWDCAALFRQ
jgi:WD40 repeat protein